MSDISIDDAAAQGENQAVTSRVLFANAALLRFGALLLILPNLLFALRVSPIMAIVIAAGALACAAVALRAPLAGAVLRQPVDLGRLSLALAVAALLLLLGGEGHVFYSNYDWLTRDAVLADLVSSRDLPSYDWQGETFFLRAPLGLYLAPAMVGRFFGLAAAHWATFAQNTLLVGVVFYFAAALAGARTAPVLAVLALFSGLDFLPVVLTEAALLIKGREAELPGHLEWWAEAFGPLKLQYSSHVTQLFWAPNHALPGWLFAIVALLAARGEIGLELPILTLAAAAFWSPLAAIGGAPFAAYLALRAPSKIFARGPLLAGAAALGLLPVAHYLTVAAAQVPHGFAFERSGYGVQWIVFVLVEVPQFALLALTWRRIERADRGLLVVAALVLAILPLFQFGSANDLVMRASIPALFVLAFAFARLAATTPRDDSALPTAISLLVILGAFTPMFEIKRAFAGRFDISACNTLAAWKQTMHGKHNDFPTNYLASAKSAGLWTASVSAAPRGLETKDCWPDHPAPELLANGTGVDARK